MGTTILGGSGFIGHNLAQAFKDPFCPPRADLYSIDDRNLGHVFYCLGDDTGAIEPNLGYLCWFLKNCSFESLTYLSSTRVYLGVPDGEEDAPLTLSPKDPGYKFNVVKLAAEQACLSHPKGRVARLSTVVGLNNANYLIPGLIRDALKKGEMNLYLHPYVIRDCIAIEDVVGLLPKLRTGKHRTYNIASGSDTTVSQIVSAIEAATGAKTIWHLRKRILFPLISISRIAEEFGFSPRPILPSIPALCQRYDDVHVKQVMWL